MACTHHSLACLALFAGTCVRAREVSAAAESACIFLDLKDQPKPQHQPAANTVFSVPAAAAAVAVELELVAEIVVAAAAAVTAAEARLHLWWKTGSCCCC